VQNFSEPLGLEELDEVAEVCVREVVERDMESRENVKTAREHRQGAQSGSFLLFSKTFHDDSRTRALELRIALHRMLQPR